MTTILAHWRTMVMRDADIFLPLEDRNYENSPLKIFIFLVLRL
jgi:hypothetical protein